MFLGGKPIEVLGKLYYRTAGGDLIDLPSDMTAAQVIQLEADARAAITKVGKGPPPQPVPDVKKLDKKEDKKTKLKPFAKGKKPGAAGKGGGKPKAGGSPSLSKVGPGKVAQYLAAKAAPIMAKGFARMQQLRTSQQKHDEAADKRTQAEASVVIPASEGQSKSNSAQVTVVGDRPAPKVDADKGKQTLQATLRENMPRKIEDVDNFKRDMKGQHTGAEVLKTMQGDKSAVVSTFQDMGHTPPPAPREHEPVALPPTEIAPATGPMNLGKDGIAPLQKEHTDLSNYTNEGDKKLTEEGVTQEQLNMVDSGDLATANKEKKGMETAAKNEPIAVQKFAQEQEKNVEKDLKQEETKRRADMNAKRKAGLGATRNKQQGAKSELEKKREEVAKKINGIYTTAQDKVKKRLADLETQSMKRFDDGNDKATKVFENEVNRDIEAFKDDRYSGWFGWARKIRDWIKGIDDLPAIKAIFDRNREKFVATINKLVENISADNKRVVQECKDELQRARTEIKEYVDKLGPSLKDIGKKAADEMSSKLDELDKFVAKKEEDLQNKLKDKQTAAIKAIDEKIEKMKEAMAGALAKLGKLLLWAAKKFFTWALEKFGFSLSTIDSIINKGAAVLKAIFTKPIQFVKNLVRAAINGFKNFGKNFPKHLKDALFEWLTDSLKGVKLPQTWDLKGIVSVALQMIGISKAEVRSVMVEVMGEPTVAHLERTFTLAKTLITEGPMAAWEQLKGMVSDLSDAFVQAVKDYIQQKIIEQAIVTVLAIFVPGAGIIKAIITIYDTIVFFIKKAKTIFEMIGSFLGSIAEIAAGNVGAAADALEKGLARGLVLVISFLASLARLSGITKAIRDAIQKLRAKVRGVLLKIAKWVWEKGRRLGNIIRGQDARSPEEKQRDLNRAVAELRPRVAELLRRGLPRPLLLARLALWRRQYKLTALRLERGDILAVINPTVNMYHVDEITLGAVLEPILQRAEARHLREELARPESRARMTRARGALASGELLPTGLTPIELGATIRGASSGDIPTFMSQTRGEDRRLRVMSVPAHPYTLAFVEKAEDRPSGHPPRFTSVRSVSVTHPTFQSEQPTHRLTYLERHLPGQTMPALGPGGINRWIAAHPGEPLHPAIAGLTAEVETARYPGNLAAHRLASSLAAPHVGATLAAMRDPRQVGGAQIIATPAEHVHGLMAGMATGDSARAAQARLTGQPLTSTQRRAERVRHGSYAVIFNTLRQALQQNPQNLLVAPGGPALQELAAQFERWLAASLPRQLDQTDEEVRRLARDLENRLFVFLRETRPR